MSTAWGRSGRDHMVIEFAAIIIGNQCPAYVSVLDTTLSD